MIDLQTKAQALNQQAVLPLLPIDSVASRAHRIRRRRRLAALLVVIPVVAGVAIGTFLVTRSDVTKPAISVQPPTTVPDSAHALSPLPPAGFLSAPPSGDRHTLVEWGWDGRRLRTVHLSATVDCCTTVVLSPDGTRLLVTGDGEVLDLQGHLIAKGVDVDGVWADDSRHLCSLRPHTSGAGMPDGPADLLLVDPGSPSRVVAQVPGYGPHTAPSILRCSIRDDEAIVAENTLATNLTITVVRLSTGVTSVPSWAPTNGAVGELVSVSGDGHYALELLRGSGPRGQVLDTRTGAVMAQVSGQPEDLSWDGHVVLETIYPSLQRQAVDWRTNAIAWRSAAQNPTCPCPLASYAFRARSNTDDLALAVTNEPGQPYGQAALWRIVDGRSALIDKAVRYGII
ncbi:MAG: hypothetical protein JWM72_230 [Actinomycetia bacterium]|nr:hypothetical protein [Actinomycetes bacterium]